MGPNSPLQMGHLNLRGVYLGVQLRMDTRWTPRRDRTTCTKVVNHSKLNNPHNWGTNMMSE